MRKHPRYVIVGVSMFILAQIAFWFLVIRYVTHVLPNEYLIYPLKDEINRRSRSFARISIPLVRRIYPQLIAENIVNVQPLMAPTGLVYYLRHQYSQNRGGTRPRPEGLRPAAVPKVVPHKREKVNWIKEGF